MIRTKIIPRNTRLHLKIPESYIGKTIEILLFPFEEVTKGKRKIPKNNFSLRGKLHLTKKQYDGFHLFVNNSRKEWK